MVSSGFADDTSDPFQVSTNQKGRGHSAHDGGRISAVDTPEERVLQGPGSSYILPIARSSIVTPFHPPWGPEGDAERAALAAPVKEAAGRPCGCASVSRPA